MSFGRIDWGNSIRSGSLRSMSVSMPSFSASPAMWLVRRQGITIGCPRFPPNVGTTTRSAGADRSISSSIRGVVSVGRSAGATRQRSASCRDLSLSRSSPRRMDAFMSGGSTSAVTTHTGQSKQASRKASSSFLTMTRVSSTRLAVQADKT